MSHEPYIRLESGESEARFEWSGFDGDDCFSDFRVIVTIAGQSRQFEFGACALHGLRKLIKVFSDPKQGAAELGFRHPDIRWCDVHRLGNEDYLLIVRYEGSGLLEEFRFHCPEVHVHHDNDE